MSDDTTTEYTEAQIMGARSKTHELRTRLDALPSHGEGDPARVKITDEIARLAPIAHAEPPVAWSAGASAEAQAAAQAELDEIAHLFDTLPEGPRRAGLIDRKIAALAVLDDVPKPLSGLPWDVATPPLRETPLPPPPPELARIPAMRTEEWDLGGLGEVKTIAAKAGKLASVPRLLTILARHDQEGQRWTEEKAIEHWKITRGYSDEDLGKIRDAANSFLAEMQAPRFIAQQTRVGQLRNPEFIEAVLRGFGRWPL